MALELAKSKQNGHYRQFPAEVKISNPEKFWHWVESIVENFL